MRCDAQMYKRIDVAAGEPRRYQRTEPHLTIINSIAIVATGAGLVSHHGGPAVRPRPPRSQAAIRTESEDEAQRTYELTRIAEACALRACM